LAKNRRSLGDELLGLRAALERLSEGVLARAQRVAGRRGAHRHAKVVARRAAEVELRLRCASSGDAGPFGLGPGTLDAAPHCAGEIVEADRPGIRRGAALPGEQAQADPIAVVVELAKRPAQARRRTSLGAVEDEHDLVGLGRGVGPGVVGEREAQRQAPARAVA
jgi:hypothetical protein